MADNGGREEDRVASLSEEKTERLRGGVVRAKNRHEENLDLPDPPPDPWVEEIQRINREEEDEEEAVDEDEEEIEEEQEQEQDGIPYLSGSGVPSMNSATSTMAIASLRGEETFEQLDRLYDLAEQILELRARSSRLFRRVRDLERSKALRNADRRAERAVMRCEDLRNEFPEEDTGFAESLLDAMLSNGRNPQRLQRRNARSPSSRQSSWSSNVRSSFDDAGTPKVSKWTRVKAAFKWERACTNDVVGMELPSTDSPAKFLRIPEVGAGSWSGSNPSSELSAPTSPIARFSSVSSSNEDVFDEPRKSISSDERKQRGSLDSESLPNQTNERKLSVKNTSKRNSAEMLKCAKESPRNAGDGNERDGVTRKPTPRLTIAIPSNEEDLRSVSSPESTSPLPSSALDSGESSPQRANARRNANGARDFKRQRLSMPEPMSPKPKMQRQDSRWNKVRRAFLSNATFSVPPSPVKVFPGHSFLQDFTTSSAQESLRTGVEDRLGNDFKKKLREWKRVKKGHRRFTDWQLWSPRSSRFGSSGNTGLGNMNLCLGTVDESEFVALEKLFDSFDEKDSRDTHSSLSDDTRLFAESRCGSEVLIRTSAGSYRFEGISREFTRKLYDWEKYRGISPRSSTFQFLTPGYEALSATIGDESPMTSLSRTGDERMFPGAPRRSKSTGNIQKTNDRDESLTRRSSSLRSLSRSVDKFDSLDPSKNVVDDSQKTGPIIDDSEPEAVIVEIEDVIEETASPLKRVQPHQTPVYSVAASETTSIAVPLGTVTSSHEPSPVILVEVADSVDRERRGTSSWKRTDSDETKERDVDSEDETRETRSRLDSWESVENSEETNLLDKDENKCVDRDRSKEITDENRDTDQESHEDDSVLSYRSIRSLDSQQDEDSNDPQEQRSSFTSTKKETFETDTIGISMKRDTTELSMETIRPGETSDYEYFPAKILDYTDLPRERETVRAFAEDTGRWKIYRSAVEVRSGADDFEGEAHSNFLPPSRRSPPTQSIIDDRTDRKIVSDFSANTISKRDSRSRLQEDLSITSSDASKEETSHQKKEKDDLRRECERFSTSTPTSNDGTLDLTNRERRCVEKIVINEETLNRIVVPTASTERTLPSNSTASKNSKDEQGTNESTGACGVFVKTKRMIFSPFRRVEESRFALPSRKNSDEDSTRSLPRRKSKSKSRSVSPKNSRQDALLLRIPLSLPWPLRTVSSWKDREDDRKTKTEEPEMTEKQTKGSTMDRRNDDVNATTPTHLKNSVFENRLEHEIENTYSEIRSMEDKDIRNQNENGNSTRSNGLLFESSLNSSSSSCDRKDSANSEIFERQKMSQSDGPFETIYFYRGRIEENTEPLRCESLPSDLAYKLKILSNAAAKRDGRADVNSETLPESRASRIRRAKESFLSKRGGPFSTSTIDSRFTDRKKNLIRSENYEAIDGPSRSNSREDGKETSTWENENAFHREKSASTWSIREIGKMENIGQRDVSFYDDETKKETDEDTSTLKDETSSSSAEIGTTKRMDEESSSSRSDLVKSASAGMIRVDPNTSREILETNRGCESLPRTISKRRESGPLRKIVGKLRLSRLIRGGNDRNGEESTMSAVSTLCRQSLFVDMEESNVRGRCEREEEPELLEDSENEKCKKRRETG